MNELMITIILVTVSLALLLVILLGIFYLVDVFLELPYVGAKKESIKNIIKLAGIKKGETVVDLGSGDGRILFESANLGAFAIGYEVNPFMIIISTLKRTLKGYDQEVKIKNKSMWTADLKIADVIFVYSLAKKMKKFEDFVFKNAKPGTRIIANTNPFPNKKPTKTLDKVFLYVA